MGDVVQIRKEQANSFPVRLREFLLFARSNKNFICVFEGKDHCYYGPRVDHYLPGSFTRVNVAMGGKRKVLQLHELKKTNRDVEAANAVFFVDKDFNLDTVSIEKHLYVTPHYSIENFYIQLSAATKLLADVFGILPEHESLPGKEKDSEYARASKFIVSVLADFNEKLGIQLNAFALTDRQSALGQKLDISRFDREAAEAFYEVTHKGFRLKKDPTYIELCLAFKADVGTVDEAAFERNVKMLRSADMLSTGRGKFVFPIFSAIARELWSDAKRTVPRLFLPKHPPSRSYTAENALSDLSQFAETPDCLRSFLKERQKHCEAIAVQN